MSNPLARQEAGPMTVGRLRALLNEMPGLHDEAQVLCWDHAAGAWQPADYDVSSVSGYTPWTSLLLGCASTFAESRSKGPQ